MAQVNLTLSFELPPLENLKDVISHVVYSCGKPAKHIAADLDMSPPELSQILAGTDGRRFPAEKLPDLIRITAPTGHLIIYWLIDRFLSDETSRRDRALSQVEAILPELQKLMEDLRR